MLCHPSVVNAKIHVRGKPVWTAIYTRPDGFINNVDLVVECRHNICKYVNYMIIRATCLIVCFVCML